MRVLLQRVSRAAVRVAGEELGSIGTGLVCLVGVGARSSSDDPEWLAEKVAGLRVFPDDDGRMNRSIAEVGGGALVISQFTLYGDARRGRRPSFVEAAPPERAADLVEALAKALERRRIPVARGSFGAHMEVELVNDGPVTLLLESPRGPREERSPERRW